MSKKILLVGIEYTGANIPEVEIEQLGLCRPEICEEKAAYSLYEYDVIIINPESYSHYIFGEKGEFSDLSEELDKLKEKDNKYDLDSVFDPNDREAELSAAITNGTRVIWVMNTNKRVNFFGYRSLYTGYVNYEAQEIMRKCEVHIKKSITLSYEEDNIFKDYFEILKRDGWKICISNYGGKGKCIATTPENYCLALEVTVGEKVGWLITRPTSEESRNQLIVSAINLEKVDVQKESYHGVFLSHTSSDKPFVRKLKEDLESHGVEEIWIDEAEIQIGDSLTKIIEQGLEKTKFICVVLSPESIESNWVQKELEVAMNREITSGEVVVLPIIIEPCKLPTFLSGKLYGDCTTPEKYDSTLGKLLRRLKK